MHDVFAHDDTGKILRCRGSGALDSLDVYVIPDVHRISRPNINHKIFDATLTKLNGNITPNQGIESVVL